MREPVPASEAPLVVCDANVFYSIALAELLQKLAQQTLPPFVARLRTLFAV